MVIFTDLSEVLIHGMFGVETILAKRFDPEVGEWFFNRRREEAVNSLFCDLMRGKLREDDYWSVVLRENPHGLSVTDVKQAFSENIRKTIPGTLDVYQRIIAYPRSFRDEEDLMVCGSPEIVLISDHISERIPELREYHPEVFKTIPKAIWSCDCGALKSDDKFFRRLLRDMRLSPKEVVFIDDLQVNLLASARANIMTICFHDAPTLEKTLAWRKFRFAPKAT